jgi:predicted secreted protein
MATSHDTSRTRRHFTFLAARGRLYARNLDRKTIDLGRLAQEDDGQWRWSLDGNGLTGAAASAEAAMRDAAQRMGFLFLDGQFTAVAQVGPTAHLDGAPAVDLVLDELQPGERMEDARV